MRHVPYGPAPWNTVLNFTANSTFNLAASPSTLWNSINYILNHKGTLTVLEVQKAIWIVRGTNTGSFPAAAVALAATATSPVGTSYVPGPGDKIAVYLDNATAQDLLVEITYGCAKLGDFVWLDSNSDGVQDVNEIGINGVTVELRDGTGNPITTTVTGPAPLPFTTNGYYQFANLCPGNYQVYINTSQPALTQYLPTGTLKGDETSKDSNLNPTSTTLGVNGDDQTLDFGFTAYPAPALACSLNSGQQGSAYSSSLTATGGIPGYTYSIIPADGLPPTLTLNPSTGAITGSLTTYGNFVFTAKVVDSRNSEAGTTTKSCNIDVPPPALSVVCATDGNGQVGSFYSATVTATGGSGGYTYALSGGALPNGVTLNSATGVISGTPTEFGTFTYQVTATDNGGRTATTGATSCIITIRPPALAVTCATDMNGQVGSFYSATVAATGGSGGYTYALSGGALPNGVTLNSSTGVVSGSPTEFGTFTYQVTATDNGGRTATTGATSCIITIRPPTLAVTCATDMNGQVGSFYSATVTATGGSGGYTYALSGGALPNGVTLNSATGVISGTPTEFGTFTYQVTVTDNGGRTANTGATNCIITIRPPTLAVTCATDMNGQVGSFYSATVTATGGSGGYTYALSGGALPNGVTLNSATGVISGSPTEYGTFTYQVTATDNGGRTATTGATSCIITIRPPTLAVTCATDMNGQVGSFYSATVTATGGSGGYTYALSGGALPNGVTLNSSTGVVSGSPTEFGTFTYQVTATDNGGRTANTGATNCIITIRPPTLTVICAPATTGAVGTPYSSAVVASGGSGGYTYAVTGGALPNGLTLNPATGVISGNPTQFGTFNYKVTATDSGGRTANTGATNCTIVIAPPPITLVCAPAGTGQVGVAYSSSLVSTGGSGGNTYSISGGSLPPGLTLNASTGLISGTPTTYGTYTYQARVTDNGGRTVTTGSTNCTIVISPSPITLVCAPATTGVVGTAFNSSLIAGGGTGGYTYSISAGSLPTGLTLNTATGAISGTPATAGAFTFTAKVVDSTGSAATAKTTNCTITIAPPPVCVTTTVTLSGGNSSSYGTAGNIRSFTSTGGVNVKASAFSKKSGTWSTAYLGHYSPGLGVTDGTEGDGSDDRHKVDNIGGSVNYVMFEFSSVVTVSRAFLDSIGADSDISVWIGTKTDPYNNHITLSDTVLSSMSVSEENLTDGTVTSRWADFNATNATGNVLIIAALATDDSPEDEFKISKLEIICPAPPPTCTGTIGDLVWKDTNGNGIQDSGEPGIPGITVQLMSGSTVLKTTTTDANGKYLFTGLCASSYNVVIANPPSGYTTSPTGKGTTSTDSNGSPAPVTLTANNANDLTIDFGFVPPAAPPVCAPDTFVLTGSSQTSGSFGNIRSFNGQTTALKVKASAFSRTSGGTWSAAYLGAYGPGLGVTDNTEGNGVDNSHKVDNIGGTTNYVLFEFNTSVIVSRAFLDYIGEDSDISVWIGTKSDPFNNHITLNDSTLSGLFTESNTYSTKVSSRWADFNGSNLSGNVLVIAAQTGGSNDEFKISKLDVICQAAPACSGSIGDYVWRDTNNNGIQNSGELGIAGVTVQLKSGSTVIKTTTTDANGHYEFLGLCSGSYTVVIPNPPAGYTASPSNQGTNRSVDSNGSAASVTLSTSSSIDTSIDFGFVPPAAPVCTPDTFTLSGANSATSGSAGNIRTFTSTNGLQVKASAFSRKTTSGAWTNAYLGQYSSGLGVTDATEGDGSNNTHKVDNIGGSVNYVLFEFSNTVAINRAFLDAIGADSDISVWIGTKSSPFTNHITLSDSVLSSLAVSLESPTTASETSRWANFNSNNTTGNVLIISALATDDSPEDEFKISKLGVTCVALGQFATYTQGGWGSTPSGNNPGALLANNFATVYTGGKVEIGGTYKLTFTSASAINTFLPAGGTPAKLTSSSTNPTSSAAGSFAGQVLSLRLSVDFSAKGITPGGLGALKLASGALAGQTVSQVLATANSVLGGGSLPSGLSVTDLSSILDAINNNFDGGVSDDGYLKF